MDVSVLSDVDDPRDIVILFLTLSPLISPV